MIDAKQDRTMNISDIKVYPVWIGFRNVCLVKVETESGIYGWGEAGLSGRELGVAGIIDHFRQFLVGRDSRNIGSIWQEMYRGQYFEGGRTLTAAISAIDIALWDIKGKSLQVPVYELLGGRQRSEIPCFVTVGPGLNDETIEQARSRVDEGWTTIRAGITETSEGGTLMQFEPRRSLALAADVLVRMRKELGSEVTLGIDLHHRLSVAEAASFCQRLPSGTLDFLEEPIRAETPSAYEALRSMTDIPFAIGEEASSKWQFLPFLQNDISNFARIDVCNVGGLTEAMKVASLAESHYIDIMPHDPLGPVCTAATVQMAAAVPNLAWCEVSPYYRSDQNVDDIFTGRVKLEGCVYQVGDRPGLGLDVDEDYVANQEFKFWEAPHLCKPDGSYTNW